MPVGMKRICRRFDVCDDALELIEVLAAVDLAAIVTQRADVVFVSALNKLSRARQLNVLRLWIRQFAKDRPTSNILQQIFETVLTAAADAEPVVSWGQSEIRRYQDGLYLLSSVRHDETKVWLWKPRETLMLKGLDIELSVSRIETRGLNINLLDREFKVAFRTGGENIRPAGRRHTHRLKKLMQEAGIPPWMRSRIPLLYLDDELVCVCGYWLAEGFIAGEGEKGWLPVCSYVS